MRIGGKTGALLKGRIIRRAFQRFFGLLVGHFSHRCRHMAPLTT
jgi:hypothetical protein